MQTREIDSNDCVMARTPEGEQLGTVLGTEGAYIIEVVLPDGRIVHGYGTVFVPLGKSIPDPEGEDWTQINVSSGTYIGNYGFVRISEDTSDQETTKGRLLQH